MNEQAKLPRAGSMLRPASSNSEELLFAEWWKGKHHCEKGFVKDGVIDPALYAKARRRVLFLLKEAYGEWTDWDLRQTIRHEWGGPKWPIWWNVTRWAYALQYVGPDVVPTYPGFFERSEWAASILFSVAIINVKKSGGEHISVMRNVAEYARLDGDLIKHQVELIAPELVLCGSTWSMIQHLWPDARPVCDWAWHSHGITFLDFWHPAARYRATAMYDAVCGLAQRALFGPRVNEESREKEW